MPRFKRVAVPGGAGYKGSVLVPQLLQKGYEVTVLDLFLYGRESLEALGHPGLRLVQGDIREAGKVRESLEGCDAVIHLACISNDPSVELDPDLSRTINYDSFGPYIQAAKQAGVQRFVFASSGSVYGVSDQPDVTEEHPLVPVSLYNQYKARCEPVLLEQASPDFVPVIVRPATICGYSPRQRLDLTVNILTNHAVNLGKITVFGGAQMRPNLHIQDICDLYLRLLEVPDELVAGEIFNASYQNFSVSQTADIVQGIVQKHRPGQEIPIVTTPSDDIRSYHVSSAKLQKVLGFVPQYRVEDAVDQLWAAFQRGALPLSLDDTRYYNLRRMKEVGLK